MRVGRCSGLVATSSCCVTPWSPATVTPRVLTSINARPQQKLSERGKQQARKIGALFAARAAPLDKVLSSRFCRALDTAGIAFEDNKAEKFEPLDLLSKDPNMAAMQNAAVVKEVASFTGDGNLVMITHQENIQALTGAGAREGEAVIVGVDGEKLRVLGRIIF